MASPYFEPKSYAPILQEGLRARMPYLAEPKGGAQAALPALGQLSGAVLEGEKKRSIMAQQKEYATYLSKLDSGTATNEDHVVGRAAGLSLGLNPPDLLGKQLQRSQIDENAATTRLKKSTADLYDRNLATPPSTGGPEIITKDGRQFQVINDPKAPGGKRYQPLAPDPWSKPATEGERLTRGFADRALQGQDELVRIMGEGYNPGAVFTTRGEYVPNFVKTDLTQQAEQAMRNFVSAVLRKESGAAIPIPELINETKKYFPMPGDKPGVIAQKNRARAQAIKGLESGAGKAASTYTKSEAAPAGGGQQIGRFNVAVEP
jgi:hypothetical protein